MSVKQASHEYRTWADAIADLLAYHTDGNDTSICPCCAFASERADAASLAYDNAIAARHMNRLGSAHTIPVWMLPTPERRDARPPTTARTTTDRTALTGV